MSEPEHEADSAPRDEKAFQDTTKLLVDRKLQFLATLGQICMAWWTATVALYALLFAAVWTNRSSLQVNPLSFDGIFAGVMIFMAMVVTFGLGIERRVGLLRNEAISFLRIHTKDETLSFDLHEFDTISFGVWLGTLSFMLVGFAWAGLAAMVWGSGWCFGLCVVLWGVCIKTAWQLVHGNLAVRLKLTSWRSTSRKL